MPFNRVTLTWWRWSIKIPIICIYTIQKRNFLWFSLFHSYSSQKSRVNVDEDFDDDDDLDNLSDDAVPDEAFYYTEIEREIEIDAPNTKSPNPPSPPTLSHRDMARPPHEDPEYQRQLVGSMRYVSLVPFFYDFFTSEYRSILKRNA